MISTLPPHYCYLDHMRILLTGTTGYIGKRLLPLLMNQGHHVICCVRDQSRFEDPVSTKVGSFEVVEGDFLKPATLQDLPKDINAAYYLMHSMSASLQGFDKLEANVANNFKAYIEQTTAQQMIYLSGISNETALSQHLESRRDVELILGESNIPLTVLRAGIIVGSGSASFEIIRDIVEKLPVMITPRWLNTRCQPLAIRDVLFFLRGVLMKQDTFGENYDIGGKDLLTYKEMLLQFAEVRELKRWIFTLPIMTPRLSSYWLYFVTSTSYNLAVNLVDSMKIDVIPKPNQLAQDLNIAVLSYKEAVDLAFQKIEQNEITSSWKDALVTSSEKSNLSEHLQIPKFGCFRDFKELSIEGSREKVLSNIWTIGGKRGWYAYNWLWKFRGYFDKLVGGVGLRRGRSHPLELNPGDPLDFWRVLVADKQNARLLLYAEMKLPGEAWLEFKIQTKEDGKEYLQQTATFRPWGILGRLYWFSVLPFHFFVFNGMINNIKNFNPKSQKN